MLISSRKKDHLLLMVVGGLGLQFTGEAVGQSLRQIASYHHDKTILVLGNLIAGLAQLLRLYVWREAFRGTGRLTSVKPGKPPDEEPRDAFPHPAETLFESSG
jgi:hypothetical protein